MQGQFYNPDALCRLLGRTNETIILLDDHRIPALIDSGAQISTITVPLVKQLGLEVQDLKARLALEGSGGIGIPYHGYVEVNFKVPEIPYFQEDILLLVIGSADFYPKTPVQIGTLQIDSLLRSVKPEDRGKITKAWETASICQTEKDTTEFALDQVKGPIKTTKTLTIPPLSSRRISAMSQVTGHSKRVHCITYAEPEAEQFRTVTANSYTVLKPGSSRVQVTLRNLTPKTITIPPGTVVAQVEAANEIPAIIQPEPGVIPPERCIECEERFEELKSKLDLTEMEQWEEKDRESALQLFQEFQYLFALDDMELGKTDKVKHKIELTDYTPFKERYRRIPPHLYEEVRKHLQDMLDIGAIRKSNSPWASAVVLVRKKDGSLRFCIDLRKLNERTVRDAQSLPRIEESLDCLNGSRLFTSLDLKSGYWQVELEEASKPLTAFTVGPLGFYECDRMPFGLTNAPATFQRLMETCLGDLHLNWCIIYLDDVIIFSKEVPEHLERLRAVFAKLRAAGLKLKPSKCEFFQKRIHFLGHVVSSEGVETDPKKLEAIVQWPQPRTVTDVRSFLGFTNHYRRFIAGYAKIAKPLYRLTSGENASKKKQEVDWDETCEIAFKKLKEICSSTPVLQYADYQKQFFLFTDASDKGLGAVLCQEDSEGKKRPVAYASRTLSQSEHNYDAHKLEFLALKWSITEQFHEYLYGGDFSVYTDNNPLTYVLTTAKLDATGQRWIASLANYRFKIYYRSGKSNADADALSRIDWSREPVTCMEPEEINAIAQAIESAIPPCEVFCGTVEVPEPAETPGIMTEEQWVELQGKDKHIGPIIEAIETGEGPDSPSPETELLWKQRSQLLIRRGLLFKKIQTRTQKDESLQFILPKDFRKQALEACHDDMGHPAHERTLEVLRQRFFWPKMTQEVKEHVQCCERCIRFKTKPGREPMGTVRATYPLELIHMDYLTIGVKPEVKKKADILVVTDHFTRFAQAYFTPSQHATHVAKVLWDQFFTVYGFPAKILSDQGGNFESKLIKQLCKLSGVTKLRTTPYRPQTNGQCERFNRTLISMLGTLDPRLKDKWPEMLPTLTFAYNALRSTATGYSPYYLMFGRHPELPVDIAFGLRGHQFGGTSIKRYVSELRKRMEWALKVANKIQISEHEKHKRHFDQKARTAPLEAGDYVLVRKIDKTKMKKIADRWTQEVYRVKSQPNKDVPVYQVVPVDQEDAPVQTLHRTMLYQIPWQLLYEDPDDSDTGDESLPLEPASPQVQPEPLIEQIQGRLMSANAELEEHLGQTPNPAPSRPARNCFFRVLQWVKIRG